MSMATATLPTPFTTDEHGVLRVGDSRVMLERVVNAFDAGASAEEIVESYPSLDLSDVYAAIAFILKNRPDIDSYMSKSTADAERVHRAWERTHSTVNLRRRLRTRASAR